MTTIMENVAIPNAALKCCLLEIWAKFSYECVLWDYNRNKIILTTWKKNEWLSRQIDKTGKDKEASRHANAASDLK